ncbi:hypothetical protein A0J61_03234 [Choanephora cucurbitarum]|uniref:Uncharacterized protein n=1 Tax=Choanephora cucurbitarum TaxID=101091 RepID=A0A1C7NJP3_9FUNG|nr:hypothetical protein A0J61_03234 [Choanephora cucurbitarum]
MYNVYQLLASTYLSAINNILVAFNLNECSQTTKGIFSTETLQEIRSKEQKTYKDSKDKFPAHLKEELEEIVYEHGLFDDDMIISKLYSKAIFKKNMKTLSHISNHVLDNCTWRLGYKVSHIVESGAMQEYFGNINPLVRNERRKTRT